MLGSSDHRPVLLNVTEHSHRTKVSTYLEFQERKLESLQRLTDNTTGAVTFFESSVDKDASMVTTAVLDARKRATLIVRRRDYTAHA